MRQIAMTPQSERPVDERKRRWSPPTGATLFPELVWTHFEWQRETRPAPSRQDEREPSATAVASGERPDVDTTDGAQSSVEAAYQETLAEFQEAEGKIVDAYWCWSEASAVALTEKPDGRLSWLRRNPRMRLHRATDWVTADLPRVATLLHYYDALAIKANEVLTPTPKRIAMEWIFSEQSYLLGFVERMGRRGYGKEAEELKELAELQKRHLLKIEEYYDRAAAKAARIYYFLGMTLLGIPALLALGAAVAAPLAVFGWIDPDGPDARNFFACYIAGALGALISVMTRMRHETGSFRVDYEVGRWPLVLLGSFRPVIGSIFGTAIYFALQSSFVQLNPTEPDEAFYFFALMAFLAGFSERFTHVILGQAERSVASPLGGQDSTELSGRGSQAQ